MKPGFQFTEDIDGISFRIIYTTHFIERYEIGDLGAGRRPVKETVTEEAIKSKIKEALDQIADIAAGDKDARGVIVSKREKFIMVFSLIERQDGFQLNLVTTSPGLNFQAKSPRDYIIKVNPIFEVIFVSDLSYALKASILDDIAANGIDLESGGTFHLGGELMDYWVERTGDRFHVVEADWLTPMYEVQVS